MCILHLQSRIQNSRVENRTQKCPNFQNSQKHNMSSEKFCELFVYILTCLNLQHCTMLQKLSKCEVKAWICWNLIILPPLQFYVKSNFGKFKRSKNVIFGNFRGSEFWFLVNLSIFQVQNLPKFKVLGL